MKKLLVLMLVLGMASLANAALTLSIYAAYDPVTDSGTLLSGDAIAGNDYILVITSDQSSAPYTGGIYLNNVAASVATMSARGPMVNTNEYSGSVDMTKAGNVSKVRDQTSGPYVGFELIANDSGGSPLAAGDWFWVDFQAVGEGTASIELYDGGFAITSLTIVPEPMTMVLLGIGGLFLRRRKK